MQLSLLVLKVDNSIYLIDFFSRLEERYILFPGLFFMTFYYFYSLMVGWSWGLRLGFLGWGFQLIGFGACGVGPTGFFGWGLSSLYINIKY